MVHRKIVTRQPWVQSRLCQVEVAFFIYNTYDMNNLDLVILLHSTVKVLKHILTKNSSLNTK